MTLWDRIDNNDKKIKHHRYLHQKLYEDKISKKIHHF